TAYFAWRQILSTQQASMIVDLTKMVVKMPEQIGKNILSRNSLIVELDWIDLFEVAGRKTLQSCLDNLCGPLYTVNQLSPRNFAIRKFGVPVSNVSGIADRRTKKVVEVADQVQRQIPCGIRNFRRRLPEVAFIPVTLDFPSKLTESLYI